MRKALINSSFLAGFSQLVRQYGGNPDQLVAQAGLKPEVLSGSGFMVPFEQHAKLLDLAARSLGCPQFALEMSELQTPAIFGPLISLCNGCHTIADAAAVFAKHMHLLIQCMRVQVKVRCDATVMILHCECPDIANSIRHQDHSVALARNIIRLLDNSNWVPRAVYLRHSETAYPERYSQFFQCPVAFNHEFTGLSFDSSILEKPINPKLKTAPANLQDHLSGQKHANFIEQVSFVISTLLTSSHCTVDGVASALGFSRRTLQRRLAEHNSSFQTLIDEVRYQRARTYLTINYYRLTDIAAMLGYSELSAFTRSFKRWFGMSPQAWRKAYFNEGEQLDVMAETTQSPPDLEPVPPTTTIQTPATDCTDEIKPSVIADN